MKQFKELKYLDWIGGIKFSCENSRMSYLHIFVFVNQQELRLCKTMHDQPDIENIGQPTYSQIWKSSSQVCVDDIGLRQMGQLDSS